MDESWLLVVKDTVGNADTQSCRKHGSIFWTKKIPHDAESPKAHEPQLLEPGVPRAGCSETREATVTRSPLTSTRGYPPSRN